MAQDDHSRSDSYDEGAGNDGGEKQAEDVEDLSAQDSAEAPSAAEPAAEGAYELFGTPDTPPGNAYQCSQGPHAVLIETVFAFTPTGEPLCPLHAGIILVPVAGDENA